MKNQNLTLQTHHKSNYTRLLLNFKTFVLFSYMISLIKWLIDRWFKICNKWNSFHNDIESIKFNLIKNAYPPFLINKVIKNYLDYKFSSNQTQKTNLTFIILNYCISATFHTILKINFRNFAKKFVKKILTLSLFLVHSKLKIIFHIKTQFLMI